MSDSSSAISAQKSNSASVGNETNPAFADAVQRARQIAAKIHSTGSDSNSVVSGVKRPLEDMNGITDGSPDAKKMASIDPYGSGQVSVQRNGADFVIEEYKVPDKMVGLIIGKGGEQIIRLQAETGCKIQLATDSGGLPDRACTLTGNRDSVQKVKAMISQIISKANSPFPPDSGMGGHMDGQYVAEMMIPGPKVGLLIGKGGENIKNLQEKGGVKMVLIQDGPQQTLHEKPLRISGDPQKVEFAKQMVMDLLAQKDMERFSNGGTQEEMMVPRQAVGVVIGKAGDMIKRIQNDSGARVQFIQGKEDLPGDKLCQITGNMDQVQKASAMIQELIQSVLMGGNEGGGGGGGRGRGRGRGRGMGGPGMRQDFGPGGPRMRGPPDGAGAEVHFAVPANKCGLVIGKGGETVRNINQQTGAHVEIARGNQPNQHEKVFIIRGNPQQIEHAKQLISERVGMPVGPNGPSGAPNVQGPGQFQPQYQQQFQQPAPGQPYGAPGWASPYQQWPNQPAAAAAGVAVATNDPAKAAADANAAWAAYYAQFYGQAGQPQPGQMQPQPQPQPQPAPAAASAAGQPDYSQAWADYYRSLGMFREAEMIEQQARSNQAQGAQPTAGAPSGGMGPPAPGAGQQPGQPGGQPAQAVTPAGTPGPGAPGYPGVYPQQGQPAPGQVPYGGGPYPGYNYAPYAGQQQFAAPAPQ